MKSRAALAIFCGSFLAFALEPMIGRILLPVFGGTPSVWVSCLAAFQLLMVAGYLYAERANTAKIRVIHTPLLAIAAAWCIGMAFCSAPLLSRVSSLTGVSSIDVLVCVLLLSGFTFVLLSANATVVQSLSGGDYRLYAISNAGSLAGLVVYPVLVEPNVSLSAQWLLLGGVIFLYAALLWKAARGTTDAKDACPETEDAPPGNQTIPQSPNRTILYLLLPALSCALLNATTSHLTLDVAPLPLLWAVLLGIFLVSYIIGFSGFGKPSLWLLPTLLAAIASAYCRTVEFDGTAFCYQLASDTALLFFGCTFIHSWLYAIRPDKDRLGRYYLLNVIGGAIGGLLTSIAAPLLFDSVLEFPVLIAATVALALLWAFAVRNRLALAAAVCAAVALVAVFCNNGNEAERHGRKAIHRSRGFFGTVEVQETVVGNGPAGSAVIHEFIHGSTVHGVQSKLKGAERMPTTYYTPYSCGYAIWGHPSYNAKKPMRVNLLGLGVGVLFAYGRTNDYYRAYEISPDALKVATTPELFSFINDCPAKKDIILGDARKGLEQELADGVEPYDVIVVDAFTGDNVPYHLSTREALELYLKMLKPDGVLCIHFTNWHLNLAPYIKRISEELELPLIAIQSRDDYPRLGYGAFVAIYCRTPKKLDKPPVNDGYARLINLNRIRSLDRLPTDDRGSFLPLLKIFADSYKVR